MKWKDLTPKQLAETASDIRDTASDKRIDRENLIEEQGFDLVGALECVARRLEREATRRAQRILSKTTPLTSADREALG
jgi:hypothetical protein